MGDGSKSMARSISCVKACQFAFLAVCEGWFSGACFFVGAGWESDFDGSGVGGECSDGFPSCLMEVRWAVDKRSDVCCSWKTFW